MHNSNLTLTGLICGLALLGACSTAPQTGALEAKQLVKGAERFADDPRLGEQTNKLCFARNVDSFSDAGNKTIVLESGANRTYLVEVAGGCTNLDQARSIGLDTNGVCATRGDHIIVSTSAFRLQDDIGMGGQRCLINRIYEWDEDAIEEAKLMSVSNDG